jgi:hypothetical protein
MMIVFAYFLGSLFLTYYVFQSNDLIILKSTLYNAIASQHLLIEFCNVTCVIMVCVNFK